jgi:hypothetical protein
MSVGDLIRAAFGQPFLFRRHRVSLKKMDETETHMADAGTLALGDTAEVGRTGYCITATCNGHELLAPGPGWFFLEVETAMAYAIAWIYHHGYKDVTRYRFSCRKRWGRVARMEVFVLGAPGVKAIVARDDFRFVDAKRMGRQSLLQKIMKWDPNPLWRGD